ncbi:MAG TPA: NAD(P)H-binding protein, partial [Phytomonospora sp.]
MIVVTGATGNVGRVLVGLLADAGEKVVAVSRTATELTTAEHREADLARPETLEGAFAGADSLFLFGGGDRPTEVVAAAKAAGIGRIVLLSSQGAGTRPENPGHGGLRAFEEAVTSSGLRWTVLRPGGFASNAFAWAEPVRTARIAPAPFADVALPFVDPADIAAV